MQSLAYVPGSNGTANPSLMTVQNVRSAGATSIITNTVSGASTKFYGTMGTPHTFNDPVTGETITVVSEATAVDFAGHIDTGHVEIDAIAPGYTDIGSKVGDIVIIRPITEWANNLFNLLSAGHNDDGTLKFLPAVDPVLRAVDSSVDFIAKDGGILSASSGLIGAIASASVYQAGLRGVLAAVTSKTYTASKDTYVDLLRAGTTAAPTYSVVYQEVANNATPPTLAANSVRAGVVVTDGTGIVMIQNMNYDPMGRILAKTVLIKAGDKLTLFNLPAKKYLRLLWSGLPSGAIRGCLTLNNDTGVSYASRLSVNGAADSTDPSVGRIAIEQVTATVRRTEYDILNIASQEKMINFVTSDNVGSGAANAPGRIEGSAKWINTSVQVSRADMTNDMAGDFAAGSEMIASGNN